MINQLGRYFLSNGFLLIAGLFLKFGLENISLFNAYKDTFERIASFIFFVLLMNLMAFSFSVFYRQRNSIHFPQQDTVIAGVKNLYLIIIAFATIILIASFFGLSIKELLTSLSIVAAAIAIISKEFITPIISGFIIAFSKVLNIGDYVQVGPHKGKIIDMTLTKILLLNEDDDLIIQSNDKVYSSDIINFTRGNHRRVSIPFIMDIKFLDTVEELESSLIAELDQYKEDIDQSSFNLRISELNKDNIEFKFQYTLNEVNRNTDRAIRKKTTRRVVNLLKEKTLVQEKLSAENPR